MSVQNIECQIAQGQITRYLAGDSFPTAVVTELEKHIADCPNCQEIVNQKKAMLQAMMRMQNAAPAKAVIEPLEDFEEDEEPVRVSDITKSKKAPRQTLSQKLVDRIAQAHVENETVTTKREAADKKKLFGKPAMYCMALAVVMVSMSYLMRDPTRLFGDRVLPKGGNTSAAATTPTLATTQAASNTGTSEESVPVDPEAMKTISANIAQSLSASTSALVSSAKPEEDKKTEASTTPVNTQKPENNSQTPSTANNGTAKEQSATTSTTAPSKPDATKAPAATTAKPTTKLAHKAPVRRPVRRTQNRVQPRRTSSPGIRVYDPSGNPIK